MQDLFESANLKSIKQQLTTKTPSPAKVCTIEQIQSNSDLIVITSYFHFPCLYLSLDFCLLQTISGLVISKYEMREVCTVRDQQQKVSYVLNFILRDSEVDFINVSVWGSSREFVENAVEKVQISFPIRIKNANVKLVTAVDVDQQFNPWTPCPYHLNVSENYGLFEKVEQRDDLEQLTCLPIRDHNDFYTIEDILSSEENDQKDVNLLFIVREIGQPQEVRTKNGKRLSKLELVVCDQTKDHFKLVLWDSELIQFALNWQKMVHVIFAVDVVVRYSAYEKTMFASASRKSIFTVNPCTKEGFQLYSFAKTVQLAPILPVVEQWKSQAIRCNIDELRNLFCQDMLNSEYVLLNAVISEFNIDASDFSKNFSLRCNTCYSKVGKFSASN